MSHGSSAHGLNKAQLDAVRTLKGPLLVLAGAGTGKTRVITYRIAELIRSGIPPSRILAVTFTNKAAREMRQRALALLKSGKKARGTKEGPEISTFHSLCVRILRRHAKKLGYGDNFTIYDRGDQESAARGALRDIRVGQQQLRPGDLIQMISDWKGRGLRPEMVEQVATSDAELLGALAYVRYQAKLRASSAMDFDDLLLLTEQLFLEHPEARFAEASRFDHLLIDEYQDTNALQYRIVRSLAERHRNLCVVGDDDQSIYGWRGAEVAHILGFREQWPDAKVVRLEENYRSTAWIIHLANTLIFHNKTRHDKKLVAARAHGEKPKFVRYEDETHEAESVVAEIRQRIMREDDERISPSSIAILFRTNEQPRAFELELRRAGVPYVLIGGQSFYDRKEVKDLVAYLRVLQNPHDEISVLRIINAPARGIGASTISLLLEEAVSGGVPLWTLLPGAPLHPGVPRAAAVGIESFVRTIEAYRARLGQEPLSTTVLSLIGEIGYKGEIERCYKEPGEQESRWNAVEEFVSSVGTYERRAEQPNLAGFLEETLLSGRDEDKEDERRDGSITLMTLHSAKGLEFPIVYMVGLEEGLLPHKRSAAEALDGSQIEEERRLCYVGVTRAREQLILSLCKQRTKWGKPRPQIPSRFLFEMRGETDKALDAARAAQEQFSSAGSRDAAEVASSDSNPGDGKKKAKPRSKAKLEKAHADKTKPGKAQPDKAQPDKTKKTKTVTAQSARSEQHAEPKARPVVVPPPPSKSATEPTLTAVVPAAPAPRPPEAPAPSVEKPSRPTAVQIGLFGD